MAQPPIKTTPEDVNAVLGYLKNKVGWVEIETVKKTLPPAHADNRKLEAMRYLGLIERDEGNIKLTDAGRQYLEAATDEGRAKVVEGQMRAIPLYHQTLEWLHHSKKTAPSKADIANYWNDHQQSEIGEAKGAALTDAAIFFLRMAALAGLGTFAPSGGGKDAHLKTDAGALGAYATGAPPPKPTEQEKSPTPPPPPPDEDGKAKVTLSTGIHVNVEIHIAPDAEASTIEEIFKDMRRYILGEPDIPKSS